MKVGIELGKHYDAGNCTPMRITKTCHKKRETVYLVRLDCCGKLKEISLQGLESRIARKPAMCRSCSARAETKEIEAIEAEIQVKLPDWTLPPMSLDLPKRWLAR